MWVLGFALFVLGIVFVIVAPINRRKNTRCSVQTQGMLINVLKRANSKGSLPSMYVYSYCVNGIEYQIKSTIRSSQIKAVGDECIIWYNPKKPKELQ